MSIENPFRNQGNIPQDNPEKENKAEQDNQEEGLSKIEKEEDKIINEVPEETKEIAEDSIEQEEKPELVLTLEDIQFVFKELLKGEKYETVRQHEDEQGLYLWDIKVPEEDGYIEYSYMRKGRYQEGQASDTAIHLTFFDKEGFPVGGHSVAKHIEGEWKLTP